MPQIVMRDAICSNLLTRAIKCLLALANEEHFRVQWFFGAFAAKLTVRLRPLSFLIDN